MRKFLTASLLMLLFAAASFAQPAEASNSCEYVPAAEGSTTIFCSEGPYILLENGTLIRANSDGSHPADVATIPPVYIPDAFNRGACATLDNLLRCADRGMTDSLPSINTATPNNPCYLNAIAQCVTSYPDPNRTINTAPPWGCTLTTAGVCDTQFPGFDRNINNAGRFGCQLDAYAFCAFVLNENHILG